MQWIVKKKDERRRIRSRKEDEENC
jgi:hypothetical protein